MQHVHTHVSWPGMDVVLHMCHVASMYIVKLMFAHGVCESGYVIYDICGRNINMLYAQGLIINFVMYKSMLATRTLYQMLTVIAALQ